MQRLNAALIFQERPTSWAIKFNASHDTALFLFANDGVPDKIDCGSNTNALWDCQTMDGEVKMRFKSQNEMQFLSQGDTVETVFVRTDDPMMYLAERILEGKYVSTRSSQTLKVVSRETSSIADTTCAIIEIAGPAVGFQAFDLIVWLAFPALKTSKLYGLTKKGERIYLSHVIDADSETIGDVLLLVDE